MYTFTQKAPHHLRWFALISVKVTCQESLITRLNMIPLISVSPVTQIGYSFGLQVVTWRCEHVTKKQKEVKETQRRRRLNQTHTHLYTVPFSVLYIYPPAKYVYVSPSGSCGNTPGHQRGCTVSLLMQSTDWHYQSSGIINILELQHCWYPHGVLLFCFVFFMLSNWTSLKVLMSSDSQWIELKKYSCRVDECTVLQWIFDTVFCVFLLSYFKRLKEKKQAALLCLKWTPHWHFTPKEGYWPSGWAPGVAAVSCDHS